MARTRVYISRPCVPDTDPNTSQIRSRTAGGNVQGPGAKNLCPVPMLTLFKERGERGLLVPEFQPGLMLGNDEDFPGVVQLWHALRTRSSSMRRCSQSWSVLTEAWRSKILLSHIRSPASGVVQCHVGGCPATSFPTNYISAEVHTILTASLLPWRRAGRRGRSARTRRSSGAACTATRASRTASKVRPLHGARHHENAEPGCL